MIEMVTAAVLLAACGGGGGDAGVDAGEPCGSNPPCGEGEFCKIPCGDIGDHTPDELASCEPIPTSCTPTVPSCGCDAVLYDSACAANMAGTDVGPASECEAPVGTFACGQLYCDGTTRFCERDLIDAGDPERYTCMPFPEACGDTPSCDCLEICFGGPGTCTDNDDGTVTVFCDFE